MQTSLLDRMSIINNELTIINNQSLIIDLYNNINIIGTQRLFPDKIILWKCYYKLAVIYLVKLYV